MSDTSDFSHVDGRPVRSSTEPAALVTRGRSEDMPDIIDFGNFVFSMDHRPHNFAGLLPKCYGERRDTSSWHYLVKEENRIQAMVMAMPQDVECPLFPEGEPLRRTGIGTVSVHYRARSRGYMRKLMHQAVRDMADQGIAYSFLGGQRQRYRYYGYETAGQQLQIELSMRNLTMTWPELAESEPGETVRLMELPSEGPLLEQAYKLYTQSTALHVRPREEFTLIGRTFGQAVYAMVREAEGQDSRLLCYLIRGEGGGSISEIVRAPEAPEWRRLLIWLMKLDRRDRLSFNLRPADGGDALALQDTLLYTADDFSMGSSGMFLIVDFAKTLAMLLADKGSRTALAPGHLELTVSGCPQHTEATQKVGITIAGQALSVRSGTGWGVEVRWPQVAAGGEASSERTARMPYDVENMPAGRLSLGYLDALAWLFSLRGYLENPLNRLLPPQIASWFPLNPYVNPADNC